MVHCGFDLCESKLVQFQNWIRCLFLHPIPLGGVISVVVFYVVGGAYRLMTDRELRSAQLWRDTLIHTLIQKPSSAEICVGVEESGLVHAAMALPAGATILAIQPPRRFTIVIKIYADAAKIIYGFIFSIYNQRGTCEQWIKEGTGAIKWTQLFYRSFAANAVRLQLHALAYNLGNFPRALALPEAVMHWSLTSLKDKLIKMGAKVISHGR
jgi:hypothetical protein